MVEVSRSLALLNAGQDIIIASASACAAFRAVGGAAQCAPASNFSLGGAAPYFAVTASQASGSSAPAAGCGGRAGGGGGRS
jgi:hypothetical protein